MAADKSRREGKEVVPTAVLDPPQAGGVMDESEIGKQRPKRNSGIVARRSTRRVSAGRSASIRRKPDPDPVKPTREIGADRTTPKDPKKSEKGQAS